MRLALGAAAAVVVAGAAVAVMAGVAGGGTGSRAPSTPVSPSDPSGTPAASHPPGWNLAGGSLAAQATVTPSAVPRGSVTGSGEAALAAGPADYEGVVPSSLRLPSGKVAPVQPAGVHDDGSLAVPDDPKRVGWWNGGAEAGERYGNVVIAGHVDSHLLGIGVLAEMRSARTGERLVVSGGGRSVAYRISSIRIVKKATLSSGNAVFAQNRPQRLVLITCGGPFNRRTHRYQDNVVIEADPV